MKSALPAAKIEKFSLPLFFVTIGVAGVLRLALLRFLALDGCSAHCVADREVAGTDRASHVGLVVASRVRVSPALPLWRRLRYHHAVWHGFVLGGSTCHFLAVLLFLVPGTN